MQADYITDLCNVSLQEDIYTVLAQTDTEKIEKGEFYYCYFFINSALVQNVANHNSAFNSNKTAKILSQMSNNEIFKYDSLIISF